VLFCFFSMRWKWTAPSLKGSPSLIGSWRKKKTLSAILSIIFLSMNTPSVNRNWTGNWVITTLAASTELVWLWKPWVIHEALNSVDSVWMIEQQKSALLEILLKFQFEWVTSKELNELRNYISQISHAIGDYEKIWNARINAHIRQDDSISIYDDTMDPIVFIGASRPDLENRIKGQINSFIYICRGLFTACALLSASQINQYIHSLDRIIKRIEEAEAAILTLGISPLPQ